MDFFDMNFCSLFLDKHGKEIFDNINSLIKKEKTESFNKDYIEIIFKVAYLDFFGVTIYSITRMIKDIMGYDIELNEIKSIHKKSIALIQKYLETSMNATIDDLK